MAPYCHLPAALSSMVANAMLGRNRHAEEEVRRGNERFGTSGSVGRAQAWALYSADTLAMLGKLEEAQEIGLHATSGTNRNAYMARYVGPYARWVARTSLLQGLISDGCERLDRLMENQKGYDAIDKAEILNAKLWLQSKSSVVSTHEINIAHSHLRLLPSAVSDQLRRMGMLDL
jgi:hypothetical protein